MTTSSVTAPPEAPVSGGEDAAAFYGRLHEQTPKAYWTPALLAANVAVFAAMVLFGHVNVMSPTSESLIAWGANFGPKTVNGEWWRLFTSMFLHIGIIHLLFNMWVLAQAGPLVERLFGNTAFLVIYVLSGLGGSLASLARSTIVVSAGASGAIFGVYGALLGYVAVHRRALPAAVSKGLAQSGVFFVGYNLFYGLMQKGIDLAAHGGGFVAGLLCGFVLSRGLESPGRAGRSARPLFVLAVGLALVVACALALNGSVADLSAAIARFSPVESRAIDTFNSMIDRYKSGKITGAEAARIAETQVLPPWRAERERFAALTHVPAAQAKLVARMLRYMKLREDAWQLFAEGARQDDAARIRQGNEKNAEAEKVVQEIKTED